MIIGAPNAGTAYVVFGTGVLVILNLAALVMKRDPELLGLTPEGERGNPSTGADPGQEIQWPFRRAVRTLGFWMLFGIYTATWIPVFVPFVHAVPLARDLGISPLLASTVVSVLGIAAFFGRVIMGAASDRIGRRAALAISLTLQALAFLGFAMVEGLLSLYLAGVAFGFSYGAISTLFPAMVSDFFGRTEAGSLVGFLFAMAGSTGAVGPVGAGWIYDTTGSYTWAFVLSALTNVVGLVLLSAARPPGNRRAPRPGGVPPSE